jgi:hypothetical protein
MRNLTRCDSHGPVHRAINVLTPENHPINLYHNLVRVLVRLKRFPLEFAIQCPSSYCFSLFILSWKGIDTL